MQGGDNVHCACQQWRICPILFNLFPQVLGTGDFFLCVVISFSGQSVYIKIVGFFDVGLRQVQRNFLVYRDIDIF